MAGTVDGPPRRDLVAAHRLDEVSVEHASPVQFGASIPGVVVPGGSIPGPLTVAPPFTTTDSIVEAATAMATILTEKYGDRMGAFAERLVGFESTAGTERAAQEWLTDRLADPGFETYTWTADPATLGDHPEFAAADEAPGEADPDPAGETYGSDARHYVAAGVPTVVYGPGRIEDAYFPDESVHWPGVEAAAGVYAGTARRFLGG